MPVYEYVCKSCGHHLEVSQSFKDAPLTTCPVCAGDLRKVFSSVGVILKGSGFYRTDSRIGSSREKAAKAGAGADKGDASGTGDGTGTKDGAGTKADSPSSTPAATSAGTSEAKPEAKPAPKTGDVAKTA